MTDHLPTVWPMSPHTKAKHDLLVKYLGAWFPILSTHNGRVVFLDGFAGPGTYSGGEPGSPTLALETLLDHNHSQNMADCEFLLIFNERDPDRFASLKQIVEDIEQEHGGLPTNIKVELVNGEFTALARNILARLKGKQLAPTFAFLDPFGYKDVPISIIANLLSFKRCELFVYFDFNSATRFATSGVVDSRFEALFGTDEFKQAPRAGDPRRKVFLHDLYQRQLEDVCGFDYVQSFEMVNDQGRTGHYLFFCTRSLTGLAAMKEAMWKVAPGGSYRFSDLLAGQPILFEDDVDTEPLQNALASAFSGETVTIKQIEDYVVGHTPFAKSHVKRRTLAPMQREGRIASPNQKRANTYPPGTLIQFL